LLTADLFIIAKLRPAGYESRSMGTSKKIERLADLAEETQAKHHERTRQAHHTELAEDYVEIISDLILANGEARGIDIAKRLGVAHVTVTKTIERLQREGLVSTKPYRSIFLTEKGQTLAADCRKRHLLVVEFLKSIGVSDATALADAEGIEHHVSDETLAAFKKLIK
jgi:DtxR family transcriptional regulator, manganese transport regulator